MKTKELAIWSIQCNMLGAIIEKNVCKVLLVNGNYLTITIGECDSEMETEKRINSVLHSLLYYPISNRDNNALELQFEITLTYHNSENHI